MELSDIFSEDCQINRYGYFRATLTIVGKVKDLWRRCQIYKATHSLLTLEG